MSKGILKTVETSSRSVEALDLCWGDIDIYTFPVRRARRGGNEPSRGGRLLTVVVCLAQNILGDNPAVSSGAPISIDWKHQDKEVVGVEYYEYLRHKTNPRRKKKDLQMTSAERDT